MRSIVNGAEHSKWFKMKWLLKPGKIPFKRCASNFDRNMEFEKNVKCSSFFLIFLAGSEKKPNLFLHFMEGECFKCYKYLCWPTFVIDECSAATFQRKKLRKFSKIYSTFRTRYILSISFSPLVCVFVFSRNLDKLNKNDNEMNNGEVKRTRKKYYFAPPASTMQDMRNDAPKHEAEKEKMVGAKNAINENAYQESRMVNTWNERFSSIKCVALFIGLENLFGFHCAEEKVGARFFCIRRLPSLPDFKCLSTITQRNSITHMKYLIASHFCALCRFHIFHISFQSFNEQFSVVVYPLETPEPRLKSTSGRIAANGQEKPWNVLIKTAYNTSNWKLNGFLAGNCQRIKIRNCVLVKHSDQWMFGRLYFNVLIRSHGKSVECRREMSPIATYATVYLRWKDWYRGHMYLWSRNIFHCVLSLFRLLFQLLENSLKCASFN